MGIIVLGCKQPIFDIPANEFSCSYSARCAFLFLILKVDNMNYSISRMDLVTRLARCVARAANVPYDLVGIDLGDNTLDVIIVLGVRCDSVQVFDSVTKKLTTVNVGGVLRVTYSNVKVNNFVNKPKFLGALGGTLLVSEIASAVFDSKIAELSKLVRTTLDIDTVNMVTLPKKTRVRKPKVSLPVTND